MGQALRRVSGRFQSSAKPRPPPTDMTSNPERRPSPPPDLTPNPERRPPPSQEVVQDRLGVSFPDDPLNIKLQNNVLKERDPQYDAMLQKMVGTIRSKPGGKLEMGESFIVQNYKRPLPKVRSSKEEFGARGERPVTPGTLTVAQLQEIILLYEGKSTGHKGPMKIHEIANKFRIDTAQVEKIVQFLSLPPEDHQEDSQN
ncbi:hypothetical protein AXF42_Ash013951 [Apostasia shenzhenica]|uniref:Uncharacterized protein n=1 Tax=Apostasia shenzhenica TaxID=1088818 RepID=A0A2I0ASC0_9ASPA|nr:hypothetical protein AXF42_Ash013951 [Apostasia shenzhenica]